jgi:hypothetical protein
VNAVLPRVEPDRATGLLDLRAWAAIAPLGALVDARDGRPPRDRTIVRAAAGPVGLHVLFECEDRDVWATHARRDAPLWEEEAVEVFLAPGARDPDRYVEIEISPAGVLFDALVSNPDARRATMRVDTSWTAAGLVGRTCRHGRASWSAELSIPWRSLGELGEAGGAWRANFYRIERPHGEAAEYSAWSPTGADPPDFHKPARFGHLVAS